MNKVLTYLWNSRTTVIGYVGVTLGVLAATDGVFSPRTLKFILLGNGILTACLGHYNNAKIRQASVAVHDDGTVGESQ
jgi:hypothetical protein